MEEIPRESTVEATAQNNGPSGQGLRCGTVYPSVKEVMIPIMQQVLQVSKNRSAGTKIAQRVADGTVRWLENITRSPKDPIHPAAFFAVIKDFESAADVDSWGKGNFAFTSGNCTSGTCSGYFQVDVKIEREWNAQNVCGANGLGIWDMKGGPDFCAALFWWLEGAGGAKCNKLTSSGNACKDPGVTWTVETFARGYKAYVQQPQWGDRSWGKMYDGGSGYNGYRHCVLDKEGGDMRAAVDAFLAQIGAAPTPVQPVEPVPTPPGPIPTPPPLPTPPVVVTTDPLDLGNHPLAAEVRDALARRLIQPYSDRTFRPEVPITRLETALLLSKVISQSAAGPLRPLPQSVTVPPYPDVPLTDPFISAIDFVKSHNLLQSFADGTFRNSAPIERGYFFAGIYKSIKLILSDLNQPDLKALSQNPQVFTDVPDDHWTAAYARLLSGFCNTAFSTQAWPGVPGPLETEMPTTRAYAAASASRAYRCLAEKVPGSVR